MRGGVVATLLLLSTICRTELYAIPPSGFSAGFGVGVPELAFGEVAFRAFGRCQIGLTATYAPPIGLPDPVDLPTQTLTLASSDVYTLTPQVTQTPLFYAIAPFIRYFPSVTNNFYLQAMFPIIKVNIKVDGAMTPRDNSSLPTVPLAGNVTLTQTLPTFSVGYVFSTRIYYINLAIGAAVMREPTTATAVSAVFPASVGGDADNELALEGINRDIEAAVTDASRDLRANYGIFPSLHLSFGFFF